MKKRQDIEELIKPIGKIMPENEEEIDYEELDNQINGILIDDAADILINAIKTTLDNNKFAQSKEFRKISASREFQRLQGAVNLIASY